MDYRKRLNSLKQKLKEFSCDAVLIEDQINLFYLTGQCVSVGALVVSDQETAFLVDNRYFEICSQKAPCPVVLSDQTSLPKLLASTLFSSIRMLGFDTENTSFKRYQELKKSVEEIPERTHKIQLMPLDNPVRHLRMIKDEEELAILKKAAELGSQGFDYLCTLLKEGISETEMAIELEIFWKKRGSKGVAFDPIIAFGANSSMPHYRAGPAKLKKGMPVLIDIGVNDHHYHSDMTRVLFFGEPPADIRKIYSIVEEAQQAALSLCRPGTLIGKLDEAAREIIAAHGYAAYFSHGLGHGVGLEIHEEPAIRNKPPYKEMPLQPGMVITIEPGIYLPGIGGVRLEDSIAITYAGYDNLTKRPIKPLLYE
jgi:Xaa-Pro aminopeptidase